MEREAEILRSLDKLSYLSRSQIQKLHRLGSNRNACRVLKNMEDYLNSFRVEENIYYLNKNGRDRVGSQVVRTKTLQYRHFIMRNDLYIYLGKPSAWQPECEIEIDEKVKIVADVMFMRYELGKERYFFGEIDNEQVMKRNIEKIEQYKKLKASNVYQQQLGYFPTLVWVTKSDRRKQDLLKYGERLKQDIYLWEEIR